MPSRVTAEDQRIDTQRARDRQQRRQQLHLDEFEMKFQCCVCLHKGEAHTAEELELEGEEDETLLDEEERKELRRRNIWAKRKKDKGLQRIHPSDASLFSQLFGKPVRGYLCDTCMGVAKALIEVIRKRGVGEPETFENRQQDERGDSPELYPLGVWVLRALEKETRCHNCGNGPCRYYNRRRLGFCCDTCFVRQRKKGDLIDVAKPMPREWIVFFELFVNHYRPKQLSLAQSAAQPAARSLFASTDVNLFQSEGQCGFEHEGSIPGEVKFSDADFSALLERRAAPVTQSSTSVEERYEGPETTTTKNDSFGPSPSAVLATGQNQHQNRAMLRQRRYQARHTTTTLFEGRRVREDGDLFSNAWDPVAPTLSEKNVHFRVSSTGSSSIGDHQHMSREEDIPLPHPYRRPQHDHDIRALVAIEEGRRALSTTATTVTSGTATPTSSSIGIPEAREDTEMDDSSPHRHHHRIAHQHEEREGFLEGEQHLEGERQGEEDDRRRRSERASRYRDEFERLSSLTTGGTSSRSDTADADGWRSSADEEGEYHEEVHVATADDDGDDDIDPLAAALGSSSSSSSSSDRVPSPPENSTPMS